MPNLSDIVFKKVCRTCLSCSEDMKSLYEASCSSTPISFAEMLMTFTPLKIFGYDGLPRHICRNCIVDLNRSYTFQLQCLESDTLLRKDIEKDVLSRGRSIFTGSILGDPHVRIEKEDDIKINPPINQVEIIQNLVPLNKSLNQITDGLIIDNNSKGKSNEEDNSSDSKIDMNKTKTLCESSQTNQNNNLTNDVLPFKRRRLFCKICSKSFTQSNKLKTHIGYHTGIKPFACTVCGSSFAKKRNLVSHHMLAHAPDNPEFSTTFEEIPIKEHTKLQSSNMVPTPLHKIPILIAETQKDLHQESHLVNQDIDVEVNIEMRNDIESNNDRSCGIIKQMYVPGNQFTSESNHTNSRSPNQNNLTNNKMFSCLMCSKSFVQSNNLTVHIRNHTGVESFGCKLCNCKFTKYRYLANHHKKVHTPVKPVIRTKLEETTFKEHTRLQCSNIVPATLHNIPLLITETQKDQESHLVNQDIDVGVNIEMKEDMESNNDRSCGINKQLNVPGNPFCEMQKDLNQQLGLINPGMDNDIKFRPPINQVEIIKNSLPYNKSINQITDGLMIENNSKRKSNETYNSNDSKLDINKTKNPSESSQTNSRSLNQIHLANDVLLPTKIISCNLLAHIPEHTGDRPFKCTICEYSFTKKRTFARHYRRVHVPEIRTNFEEDPIRELDRIKCSNIVPATLPKIPVLTNDVLPSKKRRLYCKICSKSFTQSNKLRVHIGYHAGIKPFVCTVCGSSFAKKRNLVSHHMLAHAPDNPEFSATFEENPIKEQTKLQSSNIVSAPLYKIPILIAETQKVLHQESHLANQDIDVEVNIEMRNDIESNNDRSCDSIKQIYVPDKPLNTPLTLVEMQKDQHQELDLIKHEVEFDVNIKIQNVEIIPPMHQIEISEIHCQPLSKLYDDSNIEDNTNAKCNIDTYNSQDSKIEVNKTSGIPRESSATYNRSLNPNNNLTHRKVNTFSCKVCSKVYKKKSVLKVHIMKNHPGEKPYECTVCDKLFHNNHDLASHMLTHPEKKPHVCTVCGRAFTNKPQCLIHMHYSHNVSI